MNNSFTITTATSSIQLDKQRRGNIIFTVTNSTSEIVPGRIDIATDNPAAEAWVSVVGDIEREFTPNATEQVAVQIAVPDGAPVGTYGVSLQMVGVENPDEDFTQGPSVTFEVKPIPVPEPRKFPWWIVAAAVGALLLAVIIFFVMRYFSRGPEEFNFFDNASEARWSSGAGDLAFGGSRGDNRGFAVHVTNAVFEDNRQYTALETHPQWVDNGFIRGVYEVPEIRNGQRFLAQIGFIKPRGTPGTDGVFVIVRFNNESFFSEPKLFDGRLKTLNIDLSRFAGRSGVIELEVHTNGHSGQDWLSWINPRISADNDGAGARER